MEKSIEEDVPEHDPTNPLCPGAVRSNGEVNPDYKDTFAFDNDFPALLEHVPDEKDTDNDNPLFRSKPAKGKCRVLCFHPKSNLTLPLMNQTEICNVIDSWISESLLYEKIYNWIQIFENKGLIMGCSNPHPHCQIWASSFIPNEPRIEDENQLKYYKQHKSPLLMDYVKQELEKKERIVVENTNWLVVVPYWAIWPFETMILPKRHILRLQDINHDEKLALADIMKLLLTKYDNLFQTSFPYSMGWHGNQ